MVLAIVQDKYLHKLVDALLDRDIVVTRLSSSGGFWNSGSTTLVIGIKPERMGILKEALAQCLDSGEDEAHNHVFVVPLERGMRF